MTVLIIWNEVPEDCSFVELHNLDNDGLKQLSKFHGKYINGDDKELSIEMNKFFYLENGDFRFKKIKEELRYKGYDLIIITGFIL